MKTLHLIAGALLACGVVSAKDAKDIYLDNCAVCHGPDGAAKTARGRKLKMKAVHEVLPKMSAEEMIKITETGKGQDMAGYAKELSKDEIKAVVEYYRGLAK